jgi:hypothetical protein
MAEQYQVYTNQQCEGGIGRVDIKPTGSERERLRELAARYSEAARGDDMLEKKRMWKSLRDLKPERPMILFETLSVSGFIEDDELQCENKYLRNVERTFIQALKQVDFVKDDIVLENYFQLAWQVIKSDYGVPIVEHHAENSMAYLSNFPIQTPEDLSKLKQRTFTVDRERTLGFKDTLEDIFGDIIPVRVGNIDKFFSNMGFNPFCGNNAPLITMDLFKLMGYESMAMWSYDNADALQDILKYLLEDNLNFIKWMEKEKILQLNTDNQFAGPSGYGYVSDLPEADGISEARISDCWTWIESQETNVFSPQMFNDIFLPFLSAYANLFGLVSYGCCEPVDDRIEFIKKEIPRLRTVSVSGWNNFESVAESLGKDYVYCRKPNPTFISGAKPDLDGAKEDIRRTWACTKNQPVEFIVRDVYDVDGKIDRIRDWVRMAKDIIGID